MHLVWADTCFTLSRINSSIPRGAIRISTMKRETWHGETYRLSLRFCFYQYQDFVSETLPRHSIPMPTVEVILMNAFLTCIAMLDPIYLLVDGKKPLVRSSKGTSYSPYMATPLYSCSIVRSQSHCLSSLVPSISRCAAWTTDNHIPAHTTMNPASQALRTGLEAGLLPSVS